MALAKSNHPDPSLVVGGVEKVSKWRTSASSEKGMEASACCLQRKKHKAIAWV